MTRRQRETLAYEVIARVAEMAEVWEEMLADGLLCPELADLDPDEARRQLGKWMSRLPGQLWDRRLPEPD